MITQHKAITAIETALADKDTKESDLIDLYKDIILAEDFDNARINFAWINRKIVDRWGFEGLRRIKDKAWKKIGKKELAG